MSDELKVLQDWVDELLQENSILTGSLDKIADMAAVSGNSQILSYITSVLQQLGRFSAEALKKLN